jgi:hypothetical protein
MGHLNMEGQTMSKLGQAILSFTPEYLEKLLNLSDDVKIVGANYVYEFNTPTIRLHLVGVNLPQYEEGDSIPYGMPVGNGTIKTF